MSKRGAFNWFNVWIQHCNEVVFQDLKCYDDSMKSKKLFMSLEGDIVVMNVALLNHLKLFLNLLAPRVIGT